MTQTGRYIGVDVGGTKVAVAVLEGGRVTEHDRQPTELGSPEEAQAAVWVRTGPVIRLRIEIHAAGALCIPAIIGKGRAVCLPAT